MEAVVARLGRGLVERGISVSFVVTESVGSFGDSLIRDGLPVRLVPAPGLLSNFYAPRICKALQSSSPDVVHIHSGVWLKAARAARAVGVRTVVHTVHGIFADEPWYGPSLKRLAAHASTHVVTVSESLAHYMTATVGVRSERVSVIPNGVDTSSFSPLELGRGKHDRWGIPPNAVVIGTVARLDPIKNLDVLLKAFQRVLVEEPNAFLLVVGDGPERKRLGELAHQLGIDSRTNFAGHQTVDRSVYAAMDIFVLPSQIEGTSMSLLEAMSCEVAPVASAVGGSPSVLLGAEHKCLVAPGNVDQLGTTLVQFARSPQMRLRHGRWARERVEVLYSERLMVDRYLSLYLASTKGRF